MAGQVDVATRLVALQEASPADLEDLFADWATYERDLDLLGVSDAQLAAGTDRFRLAVVWAAAKVIIAFPFAAIGVAVHLLPFQLMKKVARRPTNEGIKATVKVLGCFVLFALTYTVVGVIVGRAFGPRAGFLAAVAAPCCGYVAVRLLERVKRIGGIVEGYRIVHSNRDVLDSVLAHRLAVVRDVRSVLAEP